MFERFTHDARAVVVTARTEAEELGHHHIGTEHLLLALATGDDPVAALFRQRGADRAAIMRELDRALTTGSPAPEGRADHDRAGLGRPEDQDLDPERDSDREREALAALGIDLDQIRRAAEDTFGDGALDRARLQAHRSRRRRWRLGAGRRRHDGSAGRARSGYGRRHRFARPRPEAGPGPRFTGPRFNPRARKVLELSLREALRLRSRHIGTGHIALGLVREGQGLGCLILARLHLDLADLRAALEAEARVTAA